MPDVVLGCGGVTGLVGWLAYHRVKGSERRWGVTAEEWEACRDTRVMLALLEGVASARKLRLFACACVRRVWHLISASGRKAVRLAEGYADDEQRGVLHAARREAHRGAEPEEERSRRARGRVRYFRAEARNWAASAAWESARQNPLTAAEAHLAVAQAAGFWSQAEEAGQRRRRDRGLLWTPPSLAEFAIQADLLRCVFGNPFLPPFTVRPDALRHNDGAALKLATVIYDECDPETGLLDGARLAILADALEEAGVDDAVALKHLRSPDSLHCRGCFVVDAVLGRV